jgi:hypothetical protein
MFWILFAVLSILDARSEDYGWFVNPKFYRFLLLFHAIDLFQY